MPNHCKHCGHELVWREHKVLKPKILRQAYYFSKWEYCTNCKTVWLHEEYKIYNKSDKGRYVRNLEEMQGQSSFFKSL